MARLFFRKDVPKYRSGLLKYTLDIWFIARVAKFAMDSRNIITTLPTKKSEL